jgi:hypothetical protein
MENKFSGEFNGSAISQFRGPHYNANFWTLGGPQFMTSRAAFGPRAALLTPLL